MITITIDQHKDNAISEAEALLIKDVPASVSMLQARKALRRAGLFDTVNNAILASSDEELKDEWEYALEVRRDWASLIALAASIGITSDQLDDLFIVAGGI